jgi:hypothetical protein
MASVCELSAARIYFFTCCLKSIQDGKLLTNQIFSLASVSSTKMSIVRGDHKFPAGHFAREIAEKGDKARRKPGGQFLVNKYGAKKVLDFCIFGQFQTFHNPNKMN